MKPTTLLLACLFVLLSPSILLACGGCTDAVLLMRLPWAGYGILLVWLWILVMLVFRWRLRESRFDAVVPPVRRSTLVVFAVFGSVGYVGLAMLTMGSVLLPSICIGFVWMAYIVVRIIVDASRLIHKDISGVQAPLLIHSGFLAIGIAIIGYSQTRANTLEHCIGCLRYGHHIELFSKIMPKIVAQGDKAVGPLIRAVNAAVNDKDEFTKMNTLRNATFCLACIGGPDAEQCLSDLLKQHANPSDFYDIRWYQGACFAYARCAGPKAVEDLVALFENMPKTEKTDDRWFFVVALAMTGSKQGIAFALDHMELLFDQMESGGNGSDMRVAQTTAERLVFEISPKALTQIPAHRDWVLVGATWRADPRPNDYTSQFFWTESSQKLLRPTQEIKAAWRREGSSTRKRWAECFE
jgi:hypothetical protein